MDVKSLIARADEQFPNVCPFSQKAFFLAQLDLNIYTELLSAYDCFSAPRDEELQSPDRELLAPDGFSRMYLYYLFMQLELISGNVTGYQNQAALFNRAYLSYMNYVNRTHLISPVKIKI